MEEKKIETAVETEEVKVETATAEEPKEKLPLSDEEVARKRKSDETTLLILSIASVALAYFFPFIGLIVSIVTAMKYKKHIATYGEVAERGSIIKILIIVGIVLSGIITVTSIITSVVYIGAFGLGGVIAIIQKIVESIG